MGKRLGLTQSKPFLGHDARGPKIPISAPIQEGGGDEAEAGEGGGDQAEAGEGGGGQAEAGCQEGCA
eukprot:5076664-Prymnesium_polylepis.1